MDQAREKELREKQIKGELTKEELKEYIEALRENRVSAGYASRGAKAKKTATKEKADADMAEDLFAGLGGEKEEAEEEGETDDFAGL